MKTYKDLLVWQKAMSFVTKIYETTRSFPKEESYGLTSQIRRCAISIPSNIAEGFGRNSKNEFVRFLQIAMGSLFEIQTQLEISTNLEYLKKIEFKEIYSQSREIERMVSSLIKTIRMKSE